MGKFEDAVIKRQMDEFKNFITQFKERIAEIEARLEALEKCLVK